MAVIVSKRSRARRIRQRGPSMAVRRMLGKLAREERGAAAVEYGFLVALVVIAIIVALTSFGQANLEIWTNVATKVTAAG